MNSDYPEAKYHSADYFQYYQEKFELFAARIQNLQPQKILDTGVCTGVFYAHYLPELLTSGSIYGVDIEQEYLNIATNYGIHTKQCNLDKEGLPYPDNNFDLVLCDSFLEHTLHPMELMKEMSRVLKPEGTLLLAVPSGVSAIRRWRLLRGDSPFHALLDNLINKNFMKRCAVLYDPKDLEWIMQDHFKVDAVYFLDETLHDAKSFVVRLCRIWSRFWPPARDVIVVEATKKHSKQSL